MKTVLKNKNSVLKNSLIIGLILIGTVLLNPIFAQSNADKAINVKGMITSSDGPLDGVNIYLKNSSSGTISKSDGSFTFPTTLKTGDVLVFSYLGFVKQTFTIKPDSTNLNIVLEESAMDILSAPNSNQPYKSRNKH